jgi:hypothetical protein
MTNSHNVRSTLRKFHIPNAGTLHGFAGFFEAVLYGNVGLSTLPDRMESISPNMTSWFPLFIPLRVSGFNYPFERKSESNLAPSLPPIKFGTARFALATDRQVKSLV